MTTPYAVAPDAPGTLGEDVPAERLLRYLDELGSWRDRRKMELDALDAAALQSPDRAALTGDVILSMTLWKAVAERHDLLLATWDSGRVGPTQRRQLTTLVWGRLDPGTGDSALGVTLPEACRLSDTLASSLRRRLHLEGSEPDVVNRLRELRASLERIRDQVGLVPPGHRRSAEATRAQLAERLDTVTERAQRGADVGGLLGPLEVAAATAERDLIVAASRRDRARGEHHEAVQERAELLARGTAVRSLAERTRARVAPAPRLGIPDVSALGPVPTDPDELAAYRQRLLLVERALTQAHGAYAAALEQLEELGSRLAVVAERLEELPATAREDVGPLVETARGVLERTPADTGRAEALVAAAQAYLSRTETRR